MKRPIGIYPIAALTMCLLAGCGLIERKHQSSAVVELNGHYIYQQTIDSLTLGLSGEDSARVAQQYISQWAKDWLIYDQAKGHTDKDIERLVEDYRRNLYVHAYETYLVERRMPKTISDSAVQAVYETLSDRFQLEESLVKGMLVVVAKDAPNIDKLRGYMSEWAKRERQGNEALQDDGKRKNKSKRTDKALPIDEIEKYAYQNASGYELFTDAWQTADAITQHMPLSKTELDAQLRQNSMVEVSDSVNTYLLQVTAKCMRGERMPIEYARPEIVKIIISGRRLEFLQKERDRFYEEAVQQKKIKFYGNEK